jgi:dTDP-4-dehydrorhamnose 3,5-epimerase
MKWSRSTAERAGPGRGTPRPGLSLPSFSTVSSYASNLLAVAVEELSITGLFVVSREPARDERGFFREVVRWNELAEARGEGFVPVQWNHSQSEPRVLRALHAEAWNKLIYPVTGTMFAAIVDIRTESDTFGRVESLTLDAGEPTAVFIPSGLANSICVLGAEPVNYLYLVDAYYDGSDTRAVAWDDPDLAIEWPVADPILSERDRTNPTLRELFPEQVAAVFGPES